MSIKKIEKLNIHENPSTNQDEFDIENYLNANWNKIKDVVDNNADELVQMYEEYNKKDTEQDKEIEKIKTKDTNQDNLIKQLQEENKELKLENSLIKEQIPNGNIVGNSIHIEDSSNLEMSLKIKGGHRQETRSGKNILDYTKLTAFSTGSTSETQISGGIRITCRTTLNSLFARYIVTSLESYKGQKLTISANIKSNSSNKGMVLLCFCDKDGENRTGVIYTEEKTDGRVSLTITIPETLTENTSYLCLMLYGRRDTYDDAAIGDYVDYTNIQLEVGSSATDYEQYGVSPSPDYPCKIETTNDSVIVNVCNKNLFDKNNVSKFIGAIDGNGNLNNGHKDYRTLYIKCKANTNYTISKIVSYRFRVGTFKTIENANHMISGVFDDNSEKTALTINSGDGAIYLAVTYYVDGIDTLSEEEILDSIQIEESSIATEWEKHQSQNITIPIQQEMLEGDYIDEVEHHEWGKIVSYNGETVKAEYISTTGELTTGVTVYYKLAEPLDLELTSEQKSIMNQKLYTYKNITNIDTDNELASLDVTYKKDIETYEKRISALESVVLGGE